LKEICPKIREVANEVLRGGAAPAIVEAACEWDADLIVVGSHGYGFWSRALLGSVSNSVVHHAPCSVLIVREKQSAKF
jgi:nucleotide-binding universal stress UspA family protein